MSLDVYLMKTKRVAVYSRNITHNLGTLAEAAGIYKHCWRPEEIGITRAEQLIGPLTVALADLMARPEHYKQFDSPNGWGTYVGFIEFVRDYLYACKEDPDAEIEANS